MFNYDKFSHRMYSYFGKLIMKVTQTEIQCSIQEWECYSSKTTPSMVEDINKSILSILSSTHSPVWAQKRIYDFLNQYKEYGFRDTECEQVATNIINRYYNSNINRNECYIQL